MQHRAYPHASSACKPRSLACLSLRQRSIARKTLPTCCIRRFGYLSGFAEKYRLGELLGAGSFGTVHVGINNTTGERFAVKTIPKRYVRDQLDSALVKRVQHEVDIYMLLGSSLNIAPVYEVYEDDNCVDLVMQLCTGGELWQQLRQGAYCEHDAAHIAREVLMTVAQCHAKHVIIRDIKAENFLFLDKSQGSPLKMIDFGLADFCGPDQVLNNRVGSPVYVAPEVLKMNYTRAADLWSAGILIYQLLTGHLPFKGEFSLAVDELFKSRESFSMKDLFRAILYADLDFDSFPWPQVSPEAQDLVQRLLERDVSKRLTAEQALQHPWFTNLDAPSSAELDPSVIQRLQRFGTYSKLKQAALKQLALLVTREHGSSTPVTPSSGQWLANLHSTRLDEAVGEGRQELPTMNLSVSSPLVSSPLVSSRRQLFDQTASISADAPAVPRDLPGDRMNGTSPKSASQLFRTAQAVSDMQPTAESSADSAFEPAATGQSTFAAQVDVQAAAESASKLQSAAGMRPAEALATASSSSSLLGAPGMSAELSAALSTASRSHTEQGDGQDGTQRLMVPYDEVVTQLQQQGFELSPSEIRQLLNQFKLSKAGMLDYYGLVAALLEWRNVRSSPEWTDWVQQVFKTFDTDGTGHLEATDLTHVLCGEECPVEDTVPSLMRGLHLDPLASISFDEFSELLSPEEGDKLDLYESRVPHGEGEREGEIQGQRGEEAITGSMTETTSPEVSLVAEGEQEAAAIEQNGGVAVPSTSASDREATTCDSDGSVAVSTTSASERAAATLEGEAASTTSSLECRDELQEHNTQTNGAGFNGSGSTHTPNNASGVNLHVSGMSKAAAAMGSDGGQESTGPFAGHVGSEKAHTGCSLLTTASETSSDDHQRESVGNEPGVVLQAAGAAGQEEDRDAHKALV